MRFPWQHEKQAGHPAAGVVGVTKQSVERLRDASAAGVALEPAAVDSLSSS